MKYSFIRLGAVFAVSAILGGNAVPTYGAAMQAGLNAALSDCVRESSRLLSQKQNTAKEEAAGAEKNADEKAGKTDGTANEDDKESAKKESKKPDTICGYKNLGIANVDNYLNIREKASEDARVVGKLPADAGCEILEEKDGWYHISSGKVRGYVKGEFIISGDQARKLAEKFKKRVATVNTVTVYIREKPNTDCSILTIVTEDEELEVVKEGKEWIEVKLDDENGFVSAQYVDLSDELKKAMVYQEDSSSEGTGATNSKSSLVQTALSYVGGRYVWGGTSLSSGVDCSGFTMQIMAKYGVYLPHSSRAQAGYGRSVSTSELAAGDLIFYGSGSSISHVAIYIGNGQIVHASNSRDGIKVSNAFYRTPICCRRMF